MSAIVCTRASTNAEIQAIHSLHLKNFVKNLTQDEITSEGFVTAEYNMDQLMRLHGTSPPIIAKDGEDVVGYILVATRDFYTHHLLLDDLFNQVDKLTFDGTFLKMSRYVLCGQLCVAKGYRGKGIAKQMYDHFRCCLEGEFDFCLTDVSSANPRSLRAHLKTGFQVFDSITFDGVTFDVILWDWRRKHRKEEAETRESS